MENTVRIMFVDCEFIFPILGGKFQFLYIGRIGGGYS